MRKMIPRFSSFVKRRLRRPKVKKIFFVFSTGRCGTKFISNLLDLADNATVLHQPQPGCESINPIAYELYVEDKEKFKQILVSDFDLLSRHADIYTEIDTKIFGDCYNSIYPFAVALYNFYIKRGIETRFIHLIRHPVDCCSSILRAEGPYAEGLRQNFGHRAKLLSKSSCPAEIAGDVWININEVIKYEMEYIEGLSPGSSKLVRLEDLNDKESIVELFDWLGLSVPNVKEINKVLTNESDDVRHSHQSRLDKLKIPKVTKEELAIIKNRVQPYLKIYGY